jgi:hypothetical protein
MIVVTHNGVVVASTVSPQLKRSPQAEAWGSHYE